MAMPLAKNNFDVKAFLANIGQGKEIVRVRKKSRVDGCSSQSLASDFGARKNRDLSPPACPHAPVFDFEGTLLAHANPQDKWANPH